MQLIVLPGYGNHCRLAGGIWSVTLLILVLHATHMILVVVLGVRKKTPSLIRTVLASVPDPTVTRLSDADSAVRKTI